MSLSTEAIIAITSLCISGISVTLCGIMACKRVDNQRRIIDSHIVKVQSQRDIKSHDLLNEMNVLKNEIQTIKTNNKELTNKMTKTIQKVLGEEWTAYYDETHQAYYWYNKLSGETTWVNPVDAI